MMVSATQIEPPRTALGYAGFPKRSLDLAGATLGLLVLAPLMALVALIVRWKLGTPVMFTQARAGRFGRPFRLYKFRTMTDARGADGRALDDAARLTPWGDWLRRLSLDELPQLWNVVRGEMSLVGPRPLLLSYVERYSPRQRRRLECLPGITGYAQVLGRNALEWDDKFELDVWYADHVSLRLDVWILVRTLARLWSPRDVSAAGHATMPEFLGAGTRAADELGRRN